MAPLEPGPLGHCVTVSARTRLQRKRCGHGLLGHVVATPLVRRHILHDLASGGVLTRACPSIVHWQRRTIQQANVTIRHRCASTKPHKRCALQSHTHTFKYTAHTHFYPHTRAHIPTQPHTYAHTTLRSSSATGRQTLSPFCAAGVSQKHNAPNPTPAQPSPYSRAHALRTSPCSKNTSWA